MTEEARPTNSYSEAAARADSDHLEQDGAWPHKETTQPRSLGLHGGAAWQQRTSFNLNNIDISLERFVAVGESFGIGRWKQMSKIG